MCACVRVCVCVLGVKARALTRAVPRTGRPSRGHPGRQLQALVGNRRTGRSRSSAPSGSAAAADAAGGGAGVPSSVPSRGTCLPSAGLRRVGNQCVCVCLCPCPVSPFSWVSARSPATALQRVCRPPVAAAYRLLPWRPAGGGTLGSAGVFSVCMSLGGVFLAPSVRRVSPCLHGLLQFCVVCRVPPRVP